MEYNVTGMWNLDLFIVLMFFNHNVSRDGSSLVLRLNLLCWDRSIELASIGGHLKTKRKCYSMRQIILDRQLKKVNIGM
jgi:hypothetical protein